MANDNIKQLNLFGEEEQPISFIGSRSVFATLGATNHAISERDKDDFYSTDPMAIDKLLSKMQLHDNIWECAAGNGALSERLKEYGYNVFSSDVVERKYPLEARCDFLLQENAPQMLRDEQFDIVTNPPFRACVEFVMHALRLIKDGGYVAMFLRLSFLEGKFRYNAIFRETPPLKVLVFSERITCYKNDELKNGESGSAIAYAWFIWQKGNVKKPTIDWI